MKILVLNWQDIRNPLGGGAEVHLHEIFRRIAARGHAVTLFSCGIRGAPSEETIDGLRVIRQGRRPFFNFLVPWRYWRQFSREPYDVVVDDVNKIPFFTPLFVRRPLVGILHHLFGRSIFVEAPWPVALYVRVAEWLALRIYRRITLAVVSESTRQELIGHGFVGGRLPLVPNCVDHSRFRKFRQTDVREPVVGYLGRMKKYKSIDHLLRAFQRVAADIPQARLVLVGDGDARRELEALAGRLSVGDRITFAGYVTEEEKIRLLNAMRVVVNPSAKEGWGLTVVEANACGVPVIASDVPGLRDSVLADETGCLYEYGDIARLSELLKTILRDDEMHARLAAGALEWAQTFDWEVSASRMLRLLEEAVKVKEGSA